MSLDGFIAPPDESSSWIVADDSIDFQALYNRFDIFVMGRKTYEAISAARDYNLLRGLPKDRVIVLSKSMQADRYPSVTILQDGHLGMIEKMSREYQKSVWIMGGGWLAAECSDAGLLTSIEVAIMPVVLGDGYKLLNGVNNAYSLVLRDVNRLELSGIVMIAYDVAY